MGRQGRLAGRVRARLARDTMRESARAWARMGRASHHDGQADRIVVGRIVGQADRLDSLMPRPSHMLSDAQRAWADREFGIGWEESHDRSIGQN